MSEPNATQTPGNRREQVMVGELPSDFLRINTGSSQQQQYMGDERVAQILQAQQQAGYSTVPANARGKLSISVVSAKLVKNYGLTRMDPYCRLRVGHSVFETPTAYNGGKTPSWGKELACYLPQGVDSMYIEVFDEKSFTADDRVAWTYITIPEATLSGETVNEWFPLSGKQGDEKEGTINIVMSFVPVEDLPPAVIPSYPMYMPQMPQVFTYPAGVYPPQQQMQQVPPAMPVQRGPTKEDVKQVKEMFPDMEDEVIQSVFVTNNGNKDATINSLLQMSAD